jgi:integrase
MNRNRWTPTTLERYNGIVKNYLEPYIGGYPLKMIDRARVKRVLVEVSQIRSPKTIELVHATMSGVFSEAIDLGYTNENPARGLLAKILPPKRKRTRNMPDPFSKEDLNRLLAETRCCLNEPYSLILETMALTGMRLGECLAMHLENVDVRHSQYMVAESVRYGCFGQPKTGKRLIDLPESLTRHIEQHILKLRKKAMAEGGTAGYLFPEITHRLVQGAMKRACVSARMRTRSPHDLRHTYATLLLMDHYSPAYVQKQLGHHSITMTVDIYGHWLPGEGKKDLESTLRCSVDGLELRKGRSTLTSLQEKNA